MTFYFGDILPHLGVLFRGLSVAILVTVIAMLAGGVLAAPVCAGRLSRRGPVRMVCSVYVEAIRNTPLLVQLYLIYFWLPEIGLSLSALWSTAIGLTLHNAAYMAEIYRAGFAAVPAGQIEAGRALGMRPAQTLRHVVLVPAVRNVYPSLVNQFILMFLASSIGSIIALPELTSAVLDVNALTYRTLEVLTIGGAMYFGFCALVAALSRLFARRCFRWAAVRP